MALQDPPDDEDMDGGISEARPPALQAWKHSGAQRGPSTPSLPRRWGPAAPLDPLPSKLGQPC